MVLSAVAPTAEYTSLWLSNSTAQPVHADHHNLQGSTNIVLPLKLPPNGGDLWIELKPGDLVSGPVEERVDGKGRRWLGTTHRLERGKPFFLDPTRRHATTPWKGERVVLVAYTVNTLGKELEHEFQSLEALGFPLPASVRLPLTEQQDVRRLDVFECFEEEPLQEVVEARHPDGKTSEFAPGTVLKGGGWKETQAVEAGTVKLEVVHTVDPRDAEHCIENWMPSIHKEIGVIEKAVRRLPPAEVRSGGTLAQQDLQLSALAVLLAFFQVVGAASQSTDEEEDLFLPVSLDADLMLAVSIICIGICFIAVWEFFKWCLQGVISRREAGTAVSSLSPRKARKLQRLRDQTVQAIQDEISAREEAASSQSVKPKPLASLEYSATSISTAVGEKIPAVELKQGPEETLMPNLYQMACDDPRFVFDSLLGVGMFDGHPIVQVASNGQIVLDVPKSFESIFDAMLGNSVAEAWKLHFSCKIFGIFADDSLPVISAACLQQQEVRSKAGLTITIRDTTCWAEDTVKGLSGPLVPVAGPSPADEAACRKLCRVRSSCAYYTWEQGNCSQVVKRTDGDWLQATAKIWNCSNTDTCREAHSP
eukprot:s586_g6.t2